MSNGVEVCWRSPFRDEGRVGRWLQPNDGPFGNVGVMVCALVPAQAIGTGGQSPTQLSAEFPSEHRQVKEIDVSAVVQVAALERVVFAERGFDGNGVGSGQAFCE